MRSEIFEWSFNCHFPFQRKPRSPKVKTLTTTCKVKPFPGSPSVSRWGHRIIPLRWYASQWRTSGENAGCFADNADNGVPLSCARRKSTNPVTRASVPLCAGQSKSGTRNGVRPAASTRQNLSNNFCSQWVPRFCCGSNHSASIFNCSCCERE